MRILRTILAAALLATTINNAMADSSDRYVGGDISMLTYYEESNAIYYDTDGTQITDLLSYFAEQNLNVMRVRLFHDYTYASDDDQDSGARQDLDYVVALGKRIKDAGFNFMLDFHYSDTWADPTDQWIPKAWEDLSDDVMCDSIYNYTVMVLQTLNNAGATPDFIQIGNEISYGMLWDSQSGASTSKKYYAGTTSTTSTNYTRFVDFLTYAAKACRATCSDAQIVLHTERTPNSTYLKNFYSDMSSVDYDIIGLSYYPFYHGTLSTLESSLTVLESNFDKEIMIVEYGFPMTYWPSDATYSSSYFSDYDYTSDDDGNGAFTTDLIEMLEDHEQVTGLFWWFMESNEYNNNWSNGEYVRPTAGWYNMSLFNNSTGYVLSSMSLLQNFLDLSSSSSTEIADGDTYTLYFIDDASWGTVNVALYDSEWKLIYDTFWDNDSSPSGEAMTVCCTDDDGNTVYKYSFTYSEETGEPSYVIFFSDGGTSQTGNLTPSNGASYNSSGKVSDSATYTCEEEEDGDTYTLYFIDDASWGTVNVALYDSNWKLIYDTFWDNDSSPSGEAMTVCCTDDDGNTVYKYSFTYSEETGDPSYVIFFSDGGTSQTGNLTPSNGASYNSSGKVSDSATYTCEEEEDGDTYTLYYIDDASWGSVNVALYNSSWTMIYDSFWNNDASPSGLAMTACCTDDDGYTVYKYSFTYSEETGDPSYVIFFSDGGTSQTGNLTPSNGASYNSSGKVSDSASYTCEDEEDSTEDLYVYFVDDGTYSWTSICIVCYDGSWNQICGTSWSSSSTMTEYCTTTDGYPVYIWTYSDASTTPTSIQFFNNGNYGTGNQTDSFTFTNGATYSYSGVLEDGFECASDDDSAGDTITVDNLAATSSTYTTFTYISETSGLSYKGNSAYSSGNIQLTSDNSNAGIVSTSAAKLLAVTIVFDGSTTTGRTVDVYGNTVAYTSSEASDLYSSSTQGTKIGSAAYDGSTTSYTVEVGDDDVYYYAGVCSNSGELYLEKVIFFWDDSVTIIGEEDATTKKAIEGTDVTLIRTLSSEYLNTFCVPFNITADQISSVLGSDAAVHEFSSVSGTTLNFETAESITAGKPYLVQPSTTVANPTFESVSVVTDDPSAVTIDDYSFTGVYLPKDLATDSTEVFLATDGKLYYPADDDYTMPGLRGYFTLPKTADTEAVKISLTIDGVTDDSEATGISAVDAQAETTTGMIYTVSGQRAGNNLEALPAGLYIIGGKKVIVK